VLEETLNTVGDDTDARILLASICAQANRTGEAVVHYEKAGAAEPHSTRSLVALGNLHRQIGQFEKAHVYYQRALEVDPQDFGALVGILKHLKSGVRSRRWSALPRAPMMQRCPGAAPTAAFRAFAV
jgi:tetratricopeptide (TPR) repeat protein